MKKQLFVLMLLIGGYLTSMAQSGFVFAAGNTANNSTYSFGQLFIDNQTSVNGILSEGLQQPFLYLGTDTLLVYANQVPLEYRNSIFINQEGDTTFYLLPSLGIDSIVSVMLYSILCPQDTSVIAAYDQFATPVTLPVPTILPSGISSVATSNDELAAYPVDDTTTVTWTFAVSDKSLTCNQQVMVFFPICGDTMTVTDANGYVYNTVRIGYLCWTKENLKSTNYDDGFQTPIPVALIYNSPMYPDTMSNLNTFGRLYSWYSTMNIPEGNQTALPATDSMGFVQGVCPEGWRVPTIAELQSINTIAGGDALRTTTMWLIPGTNTTDFSALPAGIYHDGRFYNLMGDAYFWTCSNYDEINALVGQLAYSCSDMSLPYREKSDAASVRCVKK